ncbi:hypothetical protein SAMN05892883_4131 [Jatrophihabitans sp. GAS493]|uniref:hypothetical protein n=1 Tax=Jatrophihabitans sp. GAS493 TaxID=1907575 RepID=UPI000BC07FCF|nr:hypothetical protein [Jatrophihabitans sp. GAS493]SOD74937.1 hypothetical protein SAMN05892883_4131 [Jatrophihabitans sp. GAS493]
MTNLRRWRHRVTRAYQLSCARQDARSRNMVTPLGVWACQHCPHVSLTLFAFRTHISSLHTA